MTKSGPKPVRNDVDAPPVSIDFPGLERLDRPELDEDAPDLEHDPWGDESEVRRLAARPTVELLGSA